MSNTVTYAGVEYRIERTATGGSELHRIEPIMRDEPKPEHAVCGHPSCRLRASCTATQPAACEYPAGRHSDE